MGINSYSLFESTVGGEELNLLVNWLVQYGIKAGLPSALRICLWFLCSVVSYLCVSYSVIYFVSCQSSVMCGHNRRFSHKTTFILCWLESMNSGVTFKCNSMATE